MQYINFGQTGLKVSRFGMGCMRFPKIKSGNGEEVIDEQEVIKMVRYAIDNGVNYFDTAYTYAGSELVLGKALKDGYREKAIIATKLPVWKAKNYKDYEKLLDEELQRLQVDCIDIYLLHNLTQTYWESVKELDGIRFINEAKKQGKIRYKGFSIHGDFELFKEIIDANDWDMCQIQLNILDIKHQVGLEGLRYAASKGLPVVIMEPLRGGTLVQGIPEQVKSIWNKAKVKRSPAEWCFRWLYNIPEVTVILSGVSSMEQLRENIRIFENAQANVMSSEETELIDEVRNIYESMANVRCTGCKYCMPCPEGVEIPEIFKLYNDMKTLNQSGHCSTLYEYMILDSGKGADRCVECGSCETQCPQEIKIIQKLKEAHLALKGSS
ncbi:MAG: aldo/keto reductase [Acetivibrionales bacterium]|jgi:predicted aldo/keto reductase-like oxidoreductase